MYKTLTRNSLIIRTVFNNNNNFYKLCSIDSKNSENSNNSDSNDSNSNKNQDAQDLKNVLEKIEISTGASKNLQDDFPKFNDTSANFQNNSLSLEKDFPKSTENWETSLESTENWETSPKSTENLNSSLESTEKYEDYEKSTESLNDLIDNLEVGAKKAKLSGFARAFDKFSQVGSEKFSSEVKSEKRKSKPFTTLLRNSKLMQLADPLKKVVEGEIFHVVEDDLYINFGYKFYAVCPRPQKSPEEYVKGSKVRIRLQSLELSTRFLGSSTDMTLLEADANLLGLVRPFNLEKPT